MTNEVDWLKNVWAGRIIDLFCFNSFIVLVKEVRPTGARGCYIPGSRALSVTASNSTLYIINFITKKKIRLQEFWCCFCWINYIKLESTALCESAFTIIFTFRLEKGLREIDQVHTGSHNIKRQIYNFNSSLILKVNLYLSPGPQCLFLKKLLLIKLISVYQGLYIVIYTQYPFSFNYFLWTNNTYVILK